MRLADSLVDEFDVVELLDELAGYCVEFLAVDAAGLLLTDRTERLQVVAASSEQTHLVDLFAAQATDGPSLDCFSRASPVVIPDLSEQSVIRRWPRFVYEAEAHGFRSVHCLPLRLRNTAIGALTLFATTSTETELRVGRAFADAATIAILQQRSVENHNQVAAQLQRALNSRLLVEQAKARLAERRDISLDDAFRLLRGYSRHHNLRLSDLARVISTGAETSTLARFNLWADNSKKLLLDGGRGPRPAPR